MTFNKDVAEESDREAIIAFLSSIEQWDFFLDFIRKHGLTGLVYKNISDLQLGNFLPEKIWANFQSFYFRTLQRNTLLYNSYSQIVSEFLKSGIPCMPLKGIFLAESIYKDIGIRQMFDIDILIKEQYISDCLTILRNMGFREERGNKSTFIQEVATVKHLPPMYRNGISVELHYRIWIGDTNNLFSVEDFWNNSIRAEINKCPVFVMNDECQLVYLCLHVYRHLMEGNIQLFQWLDVVIILKNADGIFNWQGVQQLCEKNNCTKEVFSVLHILHKFYQIEFPESVAEYIERLQVSASEDLFLNYLMDEEKANLHLAKIQEINNLKKVSGTGNKIRFIIRDVFPRVSFLIKRYNIKNKIWIPAFYSYRFFYGLYLAFRYIIVSFFSKKSSAKFRR